MRTRSPFQTYQTARLRGYIDAMRLLCQAERLTKLPLDLAKHKVLCEALDEARRGYQP